MMRRNSRGVTRRRSLAALAVAAIALLPAWARADYPEKVITLISGFAPGGSTDIIARALAPAMSQLLGVPVIVDVKAGAAGIVGADFIAKAKPDGYTFLVTTSSPMAILPHTSENPLPYDAQKDITGISLIGITPEVLAINTKVPAKNLKELVELAKTRQVTIGSSGTGGLPHLVIELLRNSTPNAKILHVPFKSAAPALTDTLGGHVDGIFVDLPALYVQIKENALHGIAVANERRSEFLPDMPTTVEQGFPGVIGVNWSGLFAPANTPKPIIDKVHAALLAAMKTDPVKKVLAGAAVEPSVSATPADFQKFIAAEYDKWGKVAKDAGLAQKR